MNANGFTRAPGGSLAASFPWPFRGTFCGCLFGQFADEALLASAHVVPAKLLKSGYPFRYPNLEDALYQALALEKTEG